MVTAGFESSANEPLVTVADALRLPVLKCGAPQILAGGNRLDRTIRWVHTVEGRELTPWLKGGELLLTQGLSMQGSAREMDRQISALDERQIAGIVVELGAILKAVPDPVVRTCERLELPLIALHFPVRFVEITEAIHTAIVGGELELTRWERDLHRRFSDLTLSGSSTHSLLDALAVTLGNPVVLEHDGGGITYSGGRPRPEREILGAWESFVEEFPDRPAALVHQLPDVQNEASGRLVALALDRPLDQRKDLVTLETVGPFVALTYSRDPQFSRHSTIDRGILSAITRGDLDGAGASARAAAAGVIAPIGLPVVIRRARHRRAVSVAEEDRRWRSLWKDIAQELSERHAPALISPEPISLPTLAALGLESSGERSEAADRFADLVRWMAERRLGDREGAVICVGPAVHTWDALAIGFETAMEAMPRALHATSRPWHDALELDLDYLLWTLRQEPALRRFVDLRLSQLREHDRENGTDFVNTLETFMRHNGHKADAARSLHIERQSLYYRISRIESLIGVDLDDPDMRLALHLSLRAAPYLDADPN
jgi:purine catabolism regulator